MTATSSRVVYHNFSDDGKTFVDGWEQQDTQVYQQYVARSVYSGYVKTTGLLEGEMNISLTFEPTTQLNKTVSYGYARFGDRTITVDDMEE